MGVEQWRAAVGAMAKSAAPKPCSPVGHRWKKWLKASDPVAYKGCVILLVTIAQLVSSGMDLALSGVEHAMYDVEWIQEKAEEKVKEGIVCACQWTIKGVTRLRKMRFKPSAVLTTSLLSHLLALCGHILLLHYQGQWEN